MKIYCLVFILVMAVSTISGCAGANSSLVTDDMAVDEREGTVLTRMVGESFHFNIQDPEARRYFQKVDPDSLPDVQRLECLLLRSLANAESIDELAPAFDRIWSQNDQVKALIDSPSLSNGYEPLLAVMYYLLSIFPDNQWQIKTADRLYKDALKDCPPEKLSGYALHFYSLGLLNNGKLEAALPFLLRMEKCTTAEVYLGDLTYAMEKAAVARDVGITGQLLYRVCETGLLNEFPLPAVAINIAISRFDSQKDLIVFHENLAPLVASNENFGKYSFMQQLDFAVNLQNISFEETPSEIPKQMPNQDKVKIDVQIIEAGLEGQYIDPKLKDIGNEIFKSFKYRSLRLKGYQSFFLQTGSVGELILPGDQILEITPVRLTISHADIEVTVSKEQEQVFQTFIETGTGGVAIFSGPSINDNTLLIRLVTYLD